MRAGPLLLLLPAALASEARCRVFSAQWTKEHGAANAGYAYKENETYPKPDLLQDEESFPGGTRQLGDQAGGCDLTSYSHTQINRSFLLAATRPLLIIGATNNWPATEKWTAERMAAEHAESVFTVGQAGDETVGSLLRQSGRYHSGQMNQAHDCYHDGVPWNDCGLSGHDKTDVRLASNWGESWCEHVPTMFHRQYSPFLQKAASDYLIPDYLQPMRALQVPPTTTPSARAPSLAPSLPPCLLA